MTAANKARPALIAVLLSTVFPQAAHAGESRWSVRLLGRDITASASSLEAGGTLLLDLLPLATELRLKTELDPPNVAVLDSRGREWKGRSGGILLEAPGQTLTLKHPVLLTATALFLEIEAVARLAGLELILDRKLMRAELAASRESAHPVPSISGWRPLLIDKSPQEQADEQRLEEGDRQVIRGPGIEPSLPVRHDSLDLGVGLGYVTGKDSATELTGAGAVYGLKTHFVTFLTLGDRGPELYSGRLSLIAPESGWGLDAGDLATDISGSVRGARLSWPARRGRRPSLSLYLPTRGRRIRTKLLAYRDEIRLANLYLGGEIASNGAFFTRGRYLHNRLAMESYYRQATDEHGKGVLASYELWRGVRLAALARASDDALGRRDDSRTLSLRVPYKSVFDVTLERTRTISETGRADVQAVMLNLPAGVIRLMTRWQSHDIESRSGPLALASRRQELMTGVSYSAGRWVSLHLQAANQWPETGRPQSWQEFQALVRPWYGTQIQAITLFPHVLEGGRLRARVTQELSKRFSLIAEYGGFSSFQSPAPGSHPESSRFRLMIRRTFRVPTPVRGGQVRGDVRDQLGLPVPGAVVWLGSYRAITNDRGSYAFENVPPGEFDLALDPAHLPSGYASTDTARRLRVSARSRLIADFAVTLLNAVQGHVYVDQDGDGAFDPGEGLSDIVLRLDGRTTVSGKHGAYGFYNLEPGGYTVSIDVKALPEGLAAPPNPEITIQLPAGRPLGGVDFSLARHQKELIIQEPPR